MKEKLRQLAFTIDSDARTRYLLAAFQFLIAILIGLSKITILNEYSSVMFIAIVLLIFPTLIVYTILIFFYRRYGRKLLLYNKSTGILYDKNSRFFNVALRCDTLKCILNSYPHSTEKEYTESLNAIGETVGKDFAEKFSQALKTGGDQLNNNKDIIQNLFEYDSSSGMGKFTLKESEDDPMTIATVEVIHPCTGIENTLLDNFIAGYLIGIFSYVNKKNYTLKEIRRHIAAPLPSLNITITLVP